MKLIIARLRSAVATASKKLAFAARIDAILKVSILASVLFTSCSVGYHYLVYLPRRNLQIEPRGALEDFRFAGASAQTTTRVNTEQASKKTKHKLARRSEQHAEQKPPLFEQKLSEQPASEQKAIEQRQALEKADRYQACLSRATDSYNASRLAACNRPRQKIIKDQDDCFNLGFSRNVCATAHVVPDASPNCTLPRTVKLALDADLEEARDRCLEEDKNGSTVKALLSNTQIRTAGLGTVIVEPAEPAPIAPPPLSARVPSPKTAAVPITQGAALAEPIPVPAVVPKAPATASKSGAIPLAAATTVVPPEAASPDTKRQRAPTHVGWIVQIGAFDIERDAQRQLSTAHAKARPCSTTPIPTLRR
jgi:cell division septation protein DedD